MNIKFMETAVRETCKNRGYLLIRGPPGSGKKTALIRILSADGYTPVRIDDNDDESMVERAEKCISSRTFAKIAVIFSYPSECTPESVAKLLKVKRAVPIFFTDNIEYHRALVVFDANHTFKFAVAPVAKPAIAKPAIAKPAIAKPAIAKPFQGTLEVATYNPETDETTYSRIPGSRTILADDDGKRSDEAFKISDKIFENKRFLRVDSDAGFAVEKRLMDAFTLLNGAPVVDPGVSDAMSLADVLGYNSVFGSRMEAFAHICPLVKGSVRGAKYEKDPAQSDPVYQSEGSHKMPASDYMYAIQMGLIKPDARELPVEKRPNDKKRRRISAIMPAANLAKTHPLSCGTYRGKPIVELYPELYPDLN